MCIRDRSQALEAVTGSLGGFGSMGGGSLPIGAPDLAPSDDSAGLPIPSGGLGIPNF